MSTIRFFLSSNPTNLSEEIKPHATVEAEYGDVCVSGSLLTMAHHGSRSCNPAPCSGRYEIPEGIETVGLSHLDLDTVGGCAAILGRQPEAPEFWEAAEFVDLNGAHRLFGVSETVRRQLHAFWAWSEANRCFAPRDGSVLEVTEQVLQGVEIVERICALDEDLLAAGDRHREAGEALNSASYVTDADRVLLRSSESFVNYLYTTPSGVVCDAVVAFNEAHHSVTVSFADETARHGFSAQKIVQLLWGDLAGGHDGIAGSPRGQVMTMDDARRAARVIAALIH